MSAVPSLRLAPVNDDGSNCDCCLKPPSVSVDNHQPDTQLRELLYKFLEIEIESSSWICGDCRDKLQTFAQFQLEVRETKRNFSGNRGKQIRRASATPVFAEILIVQQNPSSDPFDTSGDYIKEEVLKEEKELKFEPEVKDHSECSKKIRVDGSGETESKTVPCLDCGIELLPDELIKHRVENHLRDYICDICFKTYQTKAAMLKHIRRLHIPDTEKQECESCSKVFINKKELIGHNNRYHSKETSFICDHCEGIFSSKKAMLRCRDSHYVRKKSLERRGSCPICQKTMKSNSIYSHVRLVHNKERDQVCQVCGKALKTNYDLKVHLRTHSGERPEICEICGKTFISYAQLYKHRKIRHMIRETYQCEVCKKSLLSRFKLKCHTERFHPDGLDNGIRADQETNCYHCKVCQLKFIAMHKYEKHLKLNDCHKYEGLGTIEDVKLSKGEFKCKECGSVLNTMKGLKKHIRFVHPKEPQSCKICSKQLKNPHTLWQHMTLSHKQPVKKRTT